MKPKAPKPGEEVSQAANTGRTENQKNAEKHLEAADYHHATAVLHRDANLHHLEAEKCHKESAKHYEAGEHDLAVAAAVKAYKHEESANQHIRLAKHAPAEIHAHASM